MTYAEFAVIRRHIGDILHEAHSALCRLTIADVISQGFKIGPDTYKRPPFPVLPLVCGPLVNNVISEAELERLLDA